MKRLTILFLIAIALFEGAYLITCKYREKYKSSFTSVVIRNSSMEDSVKVYVTLQSPNSVVGLFGISDTIGSCSKGYFYALKDSGYESNTSTSLLGVVVSFGGDNVPCQVAIQNGFMGGINVFEFSINTPYEVFDLSCEDGMNAMMNVSVSDSNWTTGDGENIASFDSAQNRIQLIDNVGIRGIFPYRCTDCIRLGTAVPENCFNLKDTCSAIRACQVARTNQDGGKIVLRYLGSFQILK